MKTAILVVHTTESLERTTVNLNDAQTEEHHNRQRTNKRNCGLCCLHSGNNLTTDYGQPQKIAVVVVNRT